MTRTDSLRWLAVLATLLSAGSLGDPAVVRGQHQASGGYSGIEPRGAFDRNADTGHGFYMSYLYSPGPNRMVALGASLALEEYGATEFSMPLIPSEPATEADFLTMNSVALALGVIQLKAPAATFEPYLQGTLGYARFETVTTMNEFGPLLPGLEHADGTWIWGGGGGLLVRLVEWGEPESEGDPWGRDRAYLDLGARYLRCGRVEYLEEGMLLTQEGRVDVDSRLRESEIEAIQVQVGMSFEF